MVVTNGVRGAQRPHRLVTGASAHIAGPLVSELPAAGVTGCAAWPAPPPGRTTSPGRRTWRPCGGGPNRPVFARRGDAR